MLDKALILTSPGMSQHCALLPARLSYYDVSTGGQASDTSGTGDWRPVSQIRNRVETSEIKDIIERLSLAHRKV